MRLARLIFSLALALPWADVSLAQGASGAPAAVAPAPEAAEPQERGAPARQSIRVEDGLTRIEESRLGGETTRIDVQPKGDMPAYQVAPGSGERTWKIMSF